MNSDSLIRAAAPSAAAAALVGIPADVYHFTIPGRVEAAGTVLFKVHGVLLTAAFCLLLLALLGIALRLGDRLGRAGTAGVSLAFLGTVLVAGNVATEAFWMPLAPEALHDPTGYTLATIVASFALFSAGWLLVGITAARCGLAATPPALLLCLGAIVAFTPLPGAYILLLSGVAVTARSLTSEPMTARPVAAAA